MIDAKGPDEDAGAPSMPVAISASSVTVEPVEPFVPHHRNKKDWLNWKPQDDSAQVAGMLKQLGAVSLAKKISVTNDHPVSAPPALAEDLADLDKPDTDAEVSAPRPEPAPARASVPHASTPQAPLAVISSKMNFKRVASTVDRQMALATSRGRQDAQGYHTEIYNSFKHAPAVVEEPPPSSDLSDFKAVVARAQEPPQHAQPAFRAQPAQPAFNQSPKPPGMPTYLKDLSELKEVVAQQPVQPVQPVQPAQPAFTQSPVSPGAIKYSLGSTGYHNGYSPSASNSLAALGSTGFSSYGAFDNRSFRRRSFDSDSTFSYGRGTRTASWKPAASSDKENGAVSGLLKEVEKLTGRSVPLQHSSSDGTSTAQKALLQDAIDDDDQSPARPRSRSGLSWGDVIPNMSGLALKQAAEHIDEGSPDNWGAAPAAPAPGMQARQTFLDGGSPDNWGIAASTPVPAPAPANPYW